jgi:hypothetical protein
MAAEYSTIEDDEWRVIPGYENYAISPYGTVKRITPAKLTQVGKILRYKTLRHNRVTYATREPNR